MNLAECFVSFRFSDFAFCCLTIEVAGYRRYACFYPINRYVIEQNIAAGEGKDMCNATSHLSSPNDCNPLDAHKTLPTSNPIDALCYSALSSSGTALKRSATRP